VQSIQRLPGRSLTLDSGHIGALPRSLLWAKTCRGGCHGPSHTTPTGIVIVRERFDDLRVRVLFEGDRFRNISRNQFHLRTSLVFVLTTGFWMLSRWWGLLWACFSIMAMAARIYFGIHYPGDVLAGALIGIGVTIAINNEFMQARIASPIVAVELRNPALFYALLLPFLFEVSTLFALTRSILHATFRLSGG
jgi:hypothetical protein